MPQVNVMEELVAEWYEYQGYCVRKNVPFGKGPKGGILVEYGRARLPSGV